MWRDLKALLRDEEGNATTETVIMIPFFIIVFGAIGYMGEGYRVAVDNAAKTREHAWDHAMSNCEGGTGSGTDVSVGDADLPGGGFFSDADGIIEQIIDRLPLVGDAYPGLVPDELEAHRVNEEVQRPAVLGSGYARVEHEVVLMCNEEHRTDVGLDQMSLEAWNVFGF